MFEPLLALQTAAPEALTASRFLLAGGWALALVALAVIVALAAIVGALRTIRDAGDDDLLRTVGDYVRGGNLVGAIDFCQSQDSVAGRVVAEGLQRLGRPIGDIQTVVAAAARREAARVTGALETVRSAALVAMCSGLLGTAIGDITFIRDGSAFQELWPTFVPAAVGAAIGLLLIGLYHAVAGRAAEFAATLDMLVGDFLGLLGAPSR